MATDVPIYFDNNATTALDPRVRDAMLPWLSELHGNPSSVHAFGRQAREAVETAREQVAALLGGRTEEIVFTASGSEANNAVISTVGKRFEGRGHLVTSILEHPSVRVAAGQLVETGMTLTELAPEADGRVSVDAVRGVVRDDTRLLCLMLASNELGTIQPVGEVAAACRVRNVPVLCDAVQAISKIPVDVDELGVDYLTLGGHKFHAPSGVAALWVRRGAPLDPLLVGGGQESSRRAGTENVPSIVGLGVAAELAATEVQARHAQLKALRQQFEEGLSAIPEAIVHCAGAERLPHTSHVAFLGLSGQELMLRLDLEGFAVSTGSACHAGGMPQPSASVVAMGVSADEALASIRVSFGMGNTADEVEAFLATLGSVVGELRGETRRSVGVGVGADANTVIAV